ncbi:glycoside hydrolase [Westerdykella ornata]|uniref:glucan endo-1,3-beta-D-glucosidase n=1 Tax=Westerdykella ornata TaxID=318751 RepID=A0A6A6JX31_WESOR|nr:glycoside hydrolase [Westerdykella ornata]KAF2279619.1 glycoside hydrolase [Westerdykella ornata]
MADPQHHYQAYQPYPSLAQPYDDREHASHDDSSNSQFPQSGPPPPTHRIPVGMHPDSGYSNMQSQHHYGSQNYSDFSPVGITPGADNLGEAAPGGGINGVAMGVAHAHERETGGPAAPFTDHNRYDPSIPRRPVHPQPSYGSNVPLAAAAIPPGSAFGGGSCTTSSSERSLPLDCRPTPPDSVAVFGDGPYSGYSSSNLNLAPQLGAINPNEADDDDDWGIGPQTSTQQKRRSFIPFTGSKEQSREGTPTASAAAFGAGAGAGAAYAAQDASGQYQAVPRTPGLPGDVPPILNEKSEWLASQKTGSKRLKWIVGSLIVLVIIGAIVGGVLGAILTKKKDGGGGGGGGGGPATPETVEEDNKSDLTIKSAEIKALMATPGLHKVFPGMDYTPLNAQYPECLHVPPSQNNITRDIAVMSRLTNAVRLYGTDCNQTEMVLEAIDRLELTDMKVWLGVWLGNNKTTNTRQVDQMHKILDNYKPERFKGVIVGNEVLYREDLKETELLDIVEEVRDQLKSKGSNLPVATSDLGDNWTADMATKVDAVMSNVHPFFAGVTAEEAAGWTWTFWQTHDVILTKNDPNIKQIVAEVGWPSGGGNNCGGSPCTSKTQGSVASVENLNTFMESWVCPSLKNGTEYFWFSAFDEPWKVKFNEDGKEWEDKWGLMDVNRKLKPGVKVPDCGGDVQLPG